MTAISVRNLDKRFGDRPTLRGVSFELEPGGLLGLVGPNGAGKSTLLRTLIGLVPRDAGNVAVLGHDPRTASLAIRQRTSYLPGETGVYQQMTGAAFLHFALGFYPRQNRELHDHLAAEFALPLAEKVRNYSAGMKQKLALMATLIPDVELYVLDEPDRALDAKVRFFLRDVLRILESAGKTIILCSHHLSEVETLAHRLEFLIDGRLVPTEAVTRAREVLRRRPRLRLRDQVELPAGAQLIEREPDGTLVVETAGDPLAWLQQLAPADVESAEVGVVRLEDLYQLLLHQPAEATS
ncbi:MAG: ABC transporter ATP-binding protein [bacterium]|nr:ABC transporter ATP-binding protein [bacterium]